jgi:hypothetical protein
MKVLKQPDKSNLCGQTCVAMLTDSTIEEVTDLIGKGGKTQNKDLVQALTDLKVECIQHKVKKLPECDTAIIKVRFCKGWNHWVLWVKGNIICPNQGEPVPAESYMMNNPVVVLSHIEVKI